MKYNLLFLLTLFVFLLQQADAQEKYYYKAVTDTFAINFNNKYYFSYPSVMHYTETIRLRGQILKSSDYSVFYDSSYFALNDSLPYSIFDTLYVTYNALNLMLSKEYKKRSLVVRYDDKFKDTIRVATTEGGITSESIFGSGIEKSGTLVRGFSVGTTKDFTLSSGLRLQLSGKISEDIEIVAALTDENTPIQPEGNTERLEELDKVFIQIKHPNATGIFGDYQLQRRTGEFGLLDRKLQGLHGEFNIKNFGGFASIANSKGKFNTNAFNGQDGVQGPYRLSGINNERDIVIISGTEKVFLDGIEMRRGESNDYTIEYGNSQITFTPKRLITSASRITVDFEYSDRRYQRSFFGAGTESSFFSEKFTVKVQFLREGDNEDAPIDISLSDEDKKILAEAGNNRNKAVKSGISLALPDSVGRITGTYIKVDTTFNSVPYSYVVFAPGDPNAIYNASFSYIGERQGDYVKESLGNYRFAGIGAGNYQPVIFLPMPELKQVGNLVIDLKPWDDVFLSLEYSGSLWDRNRLSNIDDNQNYGYARNIFLKVNPKKIDIGNISLGRIGFSYKDRFVQDKYTSPDRLNDVEFNRNYNTGLTAKTGNEELREIGLFLIPVNELNISSAYGMLRNGLFKSNRTNNLLRFTNSKTYNLEYNLDYVSTENINLRSYWLRQKGVGSYTIDIFRPGVEFYAEEKKDKFGLTDSLISTSLKYNEVVPFIQIPGAFGLSASAKYSIRDDYSPLNGYLFKESRSLSQFYELSYSGLKEIQTTVNFTLRKKKYVDLFKEKGLLNNETILIRSQSRFIPWDPIKGDFFYEVSTQRSAKLERVFVKVQTGTGNFKYIGDLNDNGIAEENEFEPTIYDGEYVQLSIPTEQLYPVIDLKTSTNWRIDFSKMFDPGTSFIKNAIRAISTETSWRIEENSREEDYKKIYLLNFSAFQNETNTIRGTNYLQQDLFLFENDQDLSLRFRFGQRKSLNQFSGGVERAYNRERSLRVRFRMIEEISNETEVANITDFVSAPVQSNRKRQITDNNISSDFSYRPMKNIEVGLRVKTGQSIDEYPANPTVIDLNSQMLRFNLSFAGSGRLRIEVERIELSGASEDIILPFELTGGNEIGKNYLWRLNFDYRISSNLQSTVSYDGRLQGTNRAIHTARAEVRAYF